MAQETPGRLSAVLARLAAAFAVLLVAGLATALAATLGVALGACSDSDRPSGPGGDPTIRHYTYTVVNTFPHDTQAFTQGLVYEDGFLFEGTGRRSGRSLLRRVELETGEVLQQNVIPQRFGEGITIFKNRIYQLTWVSGMCFVWDQETFAILDTLTYAGQGWGLTHDGVRLIMSDGTATISFRDPATFAVLKRVNVTDLDGLPVPELNELEYIDGEIYANVWTSTRIARIDPGTGKVRSWIELEGIYPNQGDAVLNGIAYDRGCDRLFVTGKLWPSLFEIDLVPVVPEEE